MADSLGSGLTIEAEVTHRQELLRTLQASERKQGDGGLGAKASGAVPLGPFLKASLMVHRCGCGSNIG